MLASSIKISIHSHIYKTLSIPSCMLALKRQKMGKRKKGKEERKGGAGRGLGENLASVPTLLCTWGISGCLTQTLFIEIITSFTLSTRQFDLFLWSKRHLVYHDIYKKPSPTTLRRISWAVLHVTWTEFIYLIFSPRLIGYSAHKQVMRIQLDICEILGQKAFLVCPCGGQGETGPPALWNTRLQR